MKLIIKKVQNIEDLILETFLIEAGNSIDGMANSGNGSEYDPNQYYEEFNIILDRFILMENSEFEQKLGDGTFFQKKFGSQGMFEFVSLYLAYLSKNIEELSKKLDVIIDTDIDEVKIKEIDQLIFRNAARIQILERIYYNLKENNRSTNVSIPTYDKIMETKRSITYSYAKLINKLAQKIKEATQKFNSAKSQQEKEEFAKEAVNLGDTAKKVTEDYPNEVKNPIDSAIGQNEESIKNEIGEESFNGIKQKLTVDKTVADIIHRIVRYQYTTWTSEADVNREGDLLMASINGLRKDVGINEETIIYLENLVTGIRQNLIKAIRAKDFNAKNYEGIHYDFNIKLPLYEKIQLPVTGKQIADSTKIMKLRKASQEFIDFIFGGQAKEQDAAGRAFMETGQWLHRIYAKTLNNSAKMIGKALNGREGEMKADAISRLFIPNTSVVDEPKNKQISEEAVAPGVSPQVPGSISGMGPTLAPTPTRIGSGDNFQQVVKKKKKKKSLLEFSEFINEENEEEYLWYLGLADCLGLDALLLYRTEEDFDLFDQLSAVGISEPSTELRKKQARDIDFLKKRGMANMHRHPVIFIAKLEKGEADFIEFLHKQGENEEALKMLKGLAVEIKLTRGLGNNPEKSWSKIPNRELSPMTESMLYHLNNNVPIAESIYRPGSEAHIQLLTEARKLYENGQIELDGIDKELFETTDLGKTAEFNGKMVPLDLVFESEYHGKSVELNKPMRGGAKKYHVYVMNPSTKKVKMISFGDVHGGLTAKVSDPKARKSFAARHQCHLKNDKMTAGYWACRINRYAHLWGGKTYPGFW